MKFNRKFCCLIAVFSTASQLGFAQANLKLWYNKPAANWNEALAIGNGRLAGMVYGTTATEEIQLNEETVWAGSPHNNVNPEAKDVIPQLRKLINEKKFVEAQALANQKMVSKQNGMPYQTVGSLLIKFPGHEQVNNYYRDLNISDATAAVTYEAGGVKYKREMFASFTDQAVIIRLTADKKAAINCSLSFKTPMSATAHTGDGKLTLAGIGGSKAGIDGKIKFEAQVKALNEGGKVSFSDTSINVSGATSLTVYVAMGSNFVNYHDISGNQTQKTTAYLNNAIKTPYTIAKQKHIDFYHQYFNRVNFKLDNARISNKPTDERVRDFNNGDDLGLIPLYYQFGRYLLISASQPGNQAANLQGKWNDKVSPPWGGKYTININTEMNYWPAEITNLTELTQPLISLVKDLSVTGKESASKMYGARGWMAHHNTDIWRISGLVDGGYYGMFPTGGAWLTEHLWEHYLYTGNKNYLREVYPVLKGAATFFVDALQEDPESKYLVISPDMSPENSFMRDPKVGAVSLTRGTTMSNQIVFEVLSNTISAARALNTDKAFIDTLVSRRDRLSPMRIGRWGQLQEWMDDMDKENDKHRHISHLFGLFPGKQMSPYRHPELLEAAKTTLISRGDVSTGWSMGWKVNFWARQLDGEHAYQLIKAQLKPAPETNEKGAGGGTYKNLFDAHPPFQIDGNFGCTAGITEMLMQSYDGNIHLLPAIPADWASGSINGIVTRGGFVVDMAWQNGKITKLVIKSTLGGNCRLRTPNALKGQNGLVTKAAKGENINPLFSIDEVKKPIIANAEKLKGITLAPSTLVDFATVAGKTYTLIAQ